MMAHYDGFVEAEQNAFIAKLQIENAALRAKVADLDNRLEGADNRFERDQQRIAELIARLAEVEQERDALKLVYTPALRTIVTKQVLDLQQQLASVTAERDRLAAQLASMVQPSHE